MSHNPPDNLDEIGRIMLEEGFDEAYVQAYKEYWRGNPENMRANYPALYKHFQASSAFQSAHMKLVKKRHEEVGAQLSELVTAMEQPPMYKAKVKGKKERPVLDQFERFDDQEDADKEMKDKGIIDEDLAEQKSKCNKHNQVLCGFIILATEFYGYLKDFDVSKTGRRKKMTIRQKRNFYKKRFRMKNISQIRTRREKCIKAALETMDCMRKDELFLKGMIDTGRL